MWGKNFILLFCFSELSTRTTRQCEVIQHYWRDCTVPECCLLEYQQQNYRPRHPALQHTQWILLGKESEQAALSLSPHVYVVCHVPYASIAVRSESKYNDEQLSASNKSQRIPFSFWIANIWDVWKLSNTLFRLNMYMY